MPRRRKIEIKASDLACFNTLVEALRSRPEFADFDPASLHVWAYESHEQELKNVDKAIRHHDRWLYIHEDYNELPAFDGGRLMNKKELAAALGITRPTLYRWLGSKWFGDVATNGCLGMNITLHRLFAKLCKDILPEDKANNA